MVWDGQERRRNNGHGGMLPECIEKWKNFDVHVGESGAVRDNVAKSTQQIITLEEARLSTMSEIKQINEKMDTLTDKVVGLKVWLLTGVLTIILTVFVSAIGALVYIGGRDKQIDFTASRLDKVESYIERQIGRDK